MISLITQKYIQSPHLITIKITVSQANKEGCKCHAWLVERILILCWSNPVWWAERISLTLILIKNGSRACSNIEWQGFGGFGTSCDEKGVGEDLPRMLVSRYIWATMIKSSLVCVHTLVVILFTLHATPSSLTSLSLRKSTRKRIFYPHWMLATRQQSTSVGISRTLRWNSALRSSSVLHCEWIFIVGWRPIEDTYLYSRGFWNRLLSVREKWEWGEMCQRWEVPNWSDVQVPSSDPLT